MCFAVGSMETFPAKPPLDIPLSRDSKTLAGTGPPVLSSFAIKSSTTLFFLVKAFGSVDLSFPCGIKRSANWLYPV